MKKIMLIVFMILIIFLLLVGGFVWWGYKLAKDIYTSHTVNSGKPADKELKIEHKYKAEVFFDDPQVIEFCRAIEKGEFQKAEELLKQGVNINTVGKNGMTPFLWVVKHAIMASRPKDKKQAFKFFINHKADPLKICKIDDTVYYTVLHYVATLKDSWYLKELLKSGLVKKEDIDLEVDGYSGRRTATLAALSAYRFINFKMLLDYGADVNWRPETIGRSLMEHTLTSTNWKFSYELLKRGMDFKADGDYRGPTIVNYAENMDYWPSVAINYSGTDWRQKCIAFLREKGVEVNPWMPKDEKYEKENGKYQLYINERYKRNPETKELEEISQEDKWVKFEDSYKNEHTTKSTDEQHYLDKEIEK